MSRLVRVILGLTLVGLMLGVASPVWAGWTWRNGRWEYTDDREPPLPPPPSEVKPKPAPAPPAAPAPRKPEPAPAPKTVAPAPRIEPAPMPPPAATKSEATAPANPPESTGEPPAGTTTGDTPPWWKRWQQQGQPDADRLLMADAKSYADRGWNVMADQAYKRLIKGHPASPLREEAMWQRANLLFSMKEHFKCYDQLEQLIGDYAGSPHYRDALLKEIEIAELFFGPERRRILGIPMTSGDTEAVEILRKVYEHQPAGDLADDVVLRIADHYWSKRQWPEAEDYYDRYCREYPNGEAVQRAELNRAKCAIEKCRGPRYDTTVLQLAYDRLRQFQQKFPEMAEKEGVADLLVQIRSQQAEGLYEIAARHHRANQPLAAAFYAEKLRDKYPDTPWAEKAKAFLADTAPARQEPSQ